MGMVNTYAGLIIPVTFNAFGIFLLRQFYLGIPIDLHEAAIMDGASYWGRLLEHYASAQPADLIGLGGVHISRELERVSLAVNNHDQSKPLARPTGDSKFPRSIFRRLELYYGCIGGGRGANACPLLRVPTPVGRINQDFRH